MNFPKIIRLCRIGMNDNNQPIAAKLTREECFWYESGNCRNDHKKCDATYYEKVTK